MQLRIKSTKVQTSPMYRNSALKHLPQLEPRAVLGSRYVMAKPAFVKQRLIHQKPF